MELYIIVIVKWHLSKVTQKTDCEKCQKFSPINNPKGMHNKKTLGISRKIELNIIITINIGRIIFRRYFIKEHTNSHAHSYTNSHAIIVSHKPKRGPRIVSRVSIFSMHSPTWGRP